MWICIVLSVWLKWCWAWLFFFSSRRRHTRSVSAFLLNRSSDLRHVYGEQCINTILHELNPLFTINVTMRDIKSKNVYSRSEERRVGKECKSRGSPSE